MSPAYCEVELAGNLLSLRPRWMGLGGRGSPERVQLDRGYARVVPAVDSARLLFANIAYLGVKLVGDFLFVAARRRGFGAPRRWERR